MTTVYLFRHGQTDWNVERRFQGHTDIPLNQTGRDQARELASVVSRLGVDRVLTSDLKRAHETAEIAFNGSNVPIEVCPELRETRLGEPEGWLVSEIIEKYGQESWDKWRSISEDHMDFGFPRGQTKREHLNLLRNFLNTRLKELALPKVAVSSHGGVVRRLVHSAKGSPSEPVPIPNCGVHELQVQSDEWIYIGEVGSVLE